MELYEIKMLLEPVRSSITALESIDFVAVYDHKEELGKKLGRALGNLKWAETKLELKVKANVTEQTRA